MAATSRTDDGKGFLPQKGERAFIAGQTGSGKTAFVTWLLMRYPEAPIIIYDTKDEEKFPRLPNSCIVSTMTEVMEKVDDPEYDYIIVRPPLELLNDPQELDKMLLFQYMNLRNTVCYIDEGYTFQINGRGGPGLVALYTRGRSRGITTILCSQRPVRVDRFCITEAQRLYIFRIADKQDRKRISDLIPDFDRYPMADKHHFYYFESGEDEATLFAPVKLDAGMNTGYTDNAPGGASHDESDPEKVADKDDHNPGTKHVWI